MAGKKPGRRSRFSKRMDDTKRSKQRHERGLGAKRKGNPRYKPVTVKCKGGYYRKVYKLRKRK